jgi:hypothetical protein
MTASPRQNRCDSVLALIDEALAEYERSTSAARINRHHRPNQERLP